MSIRDKRRELRIRSRRAGALWTTGGFLLLVAAALLAVRYVGRFLATTDSSQWALYGASALGCVGLVMFLYGKEM